MAATTRRVDYLMSARRHRQDAETLVNAGGKPNAGHLFGLSVECGLKAMLINMGAATTSDGSIVDGLRSHLPQLINDMTALPDGRPASALHAAVPHLSKMHDWRIEHRYWRAKDLPLGSLDNWRAAAKELLAHLDNVT
jgi:hypothetical protein